MLRARRAMLLLIAALHERLLLLRWQLRDALLRCFTMAAIIFRARLRDYADYLSATAIQRQHACYFACCCRRAMPLMRYEMVDDARRRYFSRYAPWLMLL